jgi:hypothetical protein
MSVQFTANRSARSLWMMDLDGKNRQRLTTGDFVDERACIAPDGKTIVFTSNRSGNLNLWQLDLATKQISQLRNHAGVDFRPIFSHDGKFLAFITDSSPEKRRTIAISPWPFDAARIEYLRSDFEWLHGPYFISNDLLLGHGRRIGEKDVGVFRFGRSDGSCVRLDPLLRCAHASLDRTEKWICFDSGMVKNS